MSRLSPPAAPRWPRARPAALEPSGPPAWAMSGRPPPPLPPSACRADLDEVDGVVGCDQVVGDADGEAGLAVLGDADDGDDAGADLLLAVVDQAAQVLGVEPLHRARHQLDLADGAHRALRRGRGAVARGGRRTAPAGAWRWRARAPVCLRSSSSALTRSTTSSGLVRSAPASSRTRCVLLGEIVARALRGQRLDAAHAGRRWRSRRSTRMRPMSPVRATCVPPHSSTDQALLALPLVSDPRRAFRLAHGHDAHLLAVLLAEQRHGARLACASSSAIRRVSTGEFCSTIGVGHGLDGRELLGRSWAWCARSRSAAGRAPPASPSAPRASPSTWRSASCRRWVAEWLARVAERRA